MNFLDFLKSLSFWQWIGVLFLADIVGHAVADIIRSIRK